MKSCVAGEVMWSKHVVQLRKGRVIPAGDNRNWAAAKLFILLVPFVLPVCLSELLPSPIDDFLSLTKYLSALFATLMLAYLHIMLKKPAEAFEVCIALFEITFFLTTLIEQETLRAIYEAVKMCAVETGIVAIILSASLLGCVGRFCIYIRRYYIVILSLNLLSIILFPEGMYTTEQPLNWILGFDNTHVLQFMIAIAASLIADYSLFWTMRVSKTTWYILCVSIISALLRYTFTSLILLAIVSTALIGRTHISRLDARKIAIILGFIFLASLVFPFASISFRAPISDFITKLFDKGNTFFSRTDIWIETLEAITGNAVFGHGWVDFSQYVVTAEDYLSHPHNMVLSMLFNGGVIQLILYALTVAQAVRALSLIHSGELRVCLAGVLLALMIRWNVESLNWWIQLATLALIVCVSSCECLNEPKRVAPDIDIGS